MPFPIRSHSPIPPLQPRHRHPPPAQPSPSTPYYFLRPLHCQHPLCWRSIPPCTGIHPSADNAFMNEQWELARPSTPSLASLHQSSQTLRGAREESYGLLALVGWFFGLLLGVSRIPEERVGSEEPQRGVGEVVWARVKGVGELVGGVVGAGCRKAGKLDWGRVWRVVVFGYVVYLWGRREERWEGLLAAGQGVEREVSEAVGGVRYGLVEERMGWSRSVWELPHI